MDCSAAQHLIGAWIDRQLEPHESTSLEAHLSVCAECRATADALRAQDADLLRAFQPHREAAHRVAGQVVKKWNSESSTRAPTKRASGDKWLSLLLATAAGFLLAVLLLQPWQPAATSLQAPTIIPGDRRPVQPPVARLVVATGDIEVREQGADHWQAFPDPADFHCPTGSVVRTGPSVRCELRTSEGCTIRLNDNTEITLTSGDKVAVERGQIWCSSPDNVLLKVLAGEASRKQPPAPPTVERPPARGTLWTATCPSNSSMMTAVQLDGGVQVTTADGEIEVQTTQGRERLKRGETVTIAGGEIIKAERFTDPLLAARWIHSLLIRKGHGDEELARRVDELLAQMGRSKLNVLYEQEIRSLGEHAVLPLLRFVQSPISRDEPARRLTAMRILCDIAATWAVSDLIDLLADEDPETRFFAAKALQRLTGIDHGRSPDDWRGELQECENTIRRWQQWWTENHQQYPPPVSISKAVTPPA